MGTKDFERPFSMRGITTKIKTPHGSMFITINFFEAQMKEIFVVVSKPGSEVRACAEALGRVISLALQKGVPPEDIAETLENIKTEEISWNKINGKNFTVSSIPDGISKAIKFALSLKNTPDTIKVSNNSKKNIISDKENFALESNSESAVSKKETVDDSNLGLQKAKRCGGSTQKDRNPAQKIDSQDEDSNLLSICPKCHSRSLAFQEGCYLCMNCGYTKCS